MQTIDFIGIGAAKCGTTWVAQCLEEHPDILFSSEINRKELSFFNSNTNWQKEPGRDLSTWDKGIEWYFKQFPKQEEGKIRGEFTVSYLIDELARKRIKEILPNIKLIVVLRDPVDMVQSLYYFGAASALAEKRGTIEDEIQEGHITKFGFYYKYLKPYYDDFGEKNIHVTLYDEIKSDPKKAIQDIYKFLNVKADFVPPSLEVKINEAFKPRFEFLRAIVRDTIKLLNKTNKKLYFYVLDNALLLKLYTILNKKPYKYPKMSNEIRESLRNYYLEDILLLENLIKKDLSNWKVNKDVSV